MRVHVWLCGPTLPWIAPRIPRATPQTGPTRMEAYAHGIVVFTRSGLYVNSSSLALDFNCTAAQRARYLQVRPLLKAVRCISIAECPWPFGASHRQLDPFGGSLAAPLNDDLLRFRVFIAGSRDRHSRAPAAAPPFAVEEGAARAAVLWKLVCRVVLSGHNLKSCGQLFRGCDHRA